MLSQQIVEYGAPLEARESATPVPEGTQVLLRVTRCGVCHSDVHLHDGHFEMGGGRKLDVRGARTLPFTMGHEIVGEVVSGGPDAGDLPIGERRLVYPWVGCGTCAVCRRGLEHLCLKPRCFGVNVDGGFADYLIVPHPRYLLTFDGIDQDLAAPLACSGLTAFSAIKKALPAGEGDPVLIIGAGGVGMMGIQIFQALTGCKPLVADISPEKRAAALEAGAAAVYDPADKDTAKKIMADTGGGCHAVVDFVGAEATVNLGTKAVRRAGRVILVGLFGGQLTMAIPMFMFNALTITGSMTGSLAELEELIGLVRDGKVHKIPIELRPMAEAGRTVDDLREGKVIGRVVLTN